MSHIHSALKEAANRKPLAIDGLYLTHGEESFGNPPWADASARFLVARLSPFRDVERSSPHAFLYRELRDAMPDAYIDFSFFPQGRDRTTLSELGVPFLHGVASARGGSDFDVVLISNAYTLELVNLPTLLVNSGFALSRKERARHCQPLIVLGGSNAFASAALHEDPRGGKGDSFVDAVYFGEGEGSVGRLGAALAAIHVGTERDRECALEKIADDFNGFWPTHAIRAITQGRATGPAFPESPPPVLSGEEAGTVRLEITFGCPGFCSFCFEGWERKPYRERSFDDIMAEARRLKRWTGADTVEVASYNFNAHERVVDLICELNTVFNRVNFMSQRADILADTPGLIPMEIAAEKRSFTIGVEGISRRARAYFNKE
ncbi:MAG: radical SAM protein, partial [Spirochaetales bacterium]